MRLLVLCLIAMLVVLALLGSGVVSIPDDSPAGVPASITQWWGLIQPAADRYQVDPMLVAAVMMQESGGNRDSRSRGDLLETQTPDVMLNHGLPLRGRHLRQRVTHFGAIRKRRGFSAHGYFHLHHVGRGPRTPRGRPAIHQPHVASNGHGPWHQRVCRIEGVAGPMHLQKRFLNQVVRLRGIT